MFPRHSRRAHGVLPVSYTHLDVYKRQVLGNAQLDGGVATLEVRAHGRHAVSYTHLDVYKRQLLYFMRSRRHSW